MIILVPQTSFNKQLLTATAVHLVNNISTYHPAGDITAPLVITAFIIYNRLVDFIEILRILVVFVPSPINQCKTSQQLHF
jgi:hypothetical protein